MTMKIFIFALQLTVVLGMTLAGCGHQGELGIRPSSDSGLTIKQLHQNWSDYFISYSTRIVVFDPIGDDFTIQLGDRWVLIEDSKQLTSIFKRLEVNPRFDSKDINEIIDSHGNLYGYIICASGDLVSFEKIGQKTLRLNYIPQRSPDAP